MLIELGSDVNTVDKNGDTPMHGDAFKISTLVVKMLAEFVEGTPRVDTYEVSNSTFHKIAAPLPV